MELPYVGRGRYKGSAQGISRLFARERTKQKTRSFHAWVSQAATHLKLPPETLHSLAQLATHLALITNATTLHPSTRHETRVSRPATRGSCHRDGGTGKTRHVKSVISRGLANRGGRPHVEGARGCDDVMTTALWVSCYQHFRCHPWGAAGGPACSALCRSVPTE